MVKNYMRSFAVGIHLWHYRGHLLRLSLAALCLNLKNILQTFCVKDASGIVNKWEFLNESWHQQRKPRNYLSNRCCSKISLLKILKNQLVFLQDL